MPRQLLRSGKVDFSAYKKGVKSATMRMFFGSLDSQGKSDGVITLKEWLAIMGQLGEKVTNTSRAPPTHFPRTIDNHMQAIR